MNHGGLTHQTLHGFATWYLGIVPRYDTPMHVVIFLSRNFLLSALVEGYYNLALCILSWLDVALTSVLL